MAEARAAAITTTTMAEHEDKTRTSESSNDSIRESLERHKTAEDKEGGKNTNTLTRTESEWVYPHGAALYLIITSLCLAIFLIALDRTIIATAIPSITNSFDSLPDAGWYGSAYLLTSCGFQLVFGRLYTVYPIKTVWLISISLFEIGSVICGAAPNSAAFIIGRAVAGLGTAGVFSGALVIIAYALPLHKRPLVTGLIGGLFGISSVIAPLLGGAFTDSPSLTWRWCFYINLPIGGVAMAVIALILKVQDPAEVSLTTREKLRKLDAPGTAALLPAIICLLLALQWGGSKYSWSDAKIIALLIVFGVLAIAFIVIQVIRGENATVPPRIVKNRSIQAGMWFSFFVGGGFMVFVYYLAQYFQAVLGTTPLESGIRSLGLVLSLVLGSIVSGILISKIGYYAPFMIASAVLMSIGAGLLTTLTPSSGIGMWLGFQVVFGLGIGMGMQQANLAAQTVLRRKDVSIGTSLMVFSQTLSGAIFVSVGQSLITNELVEGLSSMPGLGLDAETIISIGATDLRRIVPSELLPQVLDVYNLAIRHCFYAGLACVCLAIVGALWMEWKSVKSEKKKTAKKEEEATATEA